ncbi:MAG: DUF86 domain-containing protein [Nitrospinota bacterium]
MPRHDDTLRMQHMLDHAREAVTFLHGRDRGDLDLDRILSLALVRLVEFVGEAANRVSEDTRTRHPVIPWPQIVGLRNRLIHGYDSVDMDILWKIVDQDLPLMIEELEKILPRETQS